MNHSATIKKMPTIKRMGLDTSKRYIEVHGVDEQERPVVIATITHPRGFKNSRHCSAFLGMTPRQRSTGGVTRLGRITKCGDAYLRTLLIQGARSTLQVALRRAPEKQTRLERWMMNLYSHAGYHKTLIAIANKHARMMWAILAKGEDYDSNAWQRYPSAGARPS